MHEQDLQFHIKCKEGDVGRYCILPGDPGRSELIAQYFDHPVKIQSNREYVTYTGTLLGEKVSVCSTGIGGPSAVIAMEELHKIGADTFIRVGTCGGIRLEVQAGDVVISTGAIRHEGASREYAPIEFPAVSDYQVLTALVDSARDMGYRWHAGVVQCKDSFYGQHSPDSMPVGPRLRERWDAWVKGGCLVSEMACATLFLVGATRRVRTGGVMMIMGHHDFAPMTEAEKDASKVENLIPVAIEGMRQVIAADLAR